MAENEKSDVPSQGMKSPGLPYRCSSGIAINKWTLQFKDQEVELAHREARMDSVNAQCLLTIINLSMLAVYFTGVLTGCGSIQKHFLPLSVWHVFYQAAEVFLMKQSFFRDLYRQQVLLEGYKLAWTAFTFTFFNIWHSTYHQPEVAEFEIDMHPEFCTHFGLGSNGIVVLCVALIPYITFSSLFFKLLMSTSILTIHTIAPFWLPISIELPVIGMNVVVGNALGYLIEYALRSAFREQYARRADQELSTMCKVGADLRLTHTIKGKCGTANGLAYGVIACLQHVRHEQVDRAVKLMERMRLVLDETEWWCNHRQLFVHLELGTYRSKRSVCDVDARLATLVGTDGLARMGPASSVEVDEVVLGLALDEALANARKYRDPRTQIGLSARVAKCGSAFMLHVEVDSINRADVPLLSHEQCERVIRAGYKAHRISAFSDGVGLANVQQAAGAVGGRIWMHGYSTFARLDHTVFHLLLPVERVVWRRPDEDSGARYGRPSAEAPDMRNLAVVKGAAQRDAPAEWPEHKKEASAPSLALAQAQAQAQAPALSPALPPAPPSPALRPASPSEAVAKTMEAMSKMSGAVMFAQPSAPARVRSAPLICLGLDDSSICRTLHELVFEDFLLADMSRSASMGATSEEVDAFVDVALGLLSPTLRPVREAERRAADVVIIDQNIAIDSKRWNGSDVAKTLAARGFRGVISLMSGTDSEHLRELEAADHVDVAFSKGDTPAYVAEKIMAIVKGSVR